MAAVERRQRPKVSAREHNAVVKAAQKRVDDLEPRLATIIETILARAGTKAAARFQDKALRHFGASAANADVASTSTMIALKPRPVEAAALADPDGDPPEILHVTLAYLGETDQPLQEIADALKPVAASYAPLSGVVGGYGTFDPPGVGILLPDVRGLVETRTAVAEALLDAGINFSRDHGFLPHLTVNDGNVGLTNASADVGGASGTTARGGETGRRLPDLREEPVGSERAGEGFGATDSSPSDRLDGGEGLPALGGSPASSLPEGPVSEYTTHAGRHELGARSDSQPGASRVFDPRDALRAAGQSRLGDLSRLPTRSDSALAGAAEEVGSYPESASGAPLHFDSLHIVRGNDEEVALPLVGVRALTAAASWTPPYPDELIDVNALVQQILAKTDPVRRAMIEQTMTPALEQAGLSWDVSNPLTAQMLAVSASQVTNIAMTTRANLMKIIGSAYQNGLTVPQTAGLIRDGMKAASKVRSTMIARTELARAVNGGSLAATQLVASVTGQKYNKVWHTAPGARYPRHEDYAGLDGQTVPQDATFEVGGDQLQFPGDPNGEPGETINCRCTLTYTEAPVAAGQSEAEQEPGLIQTIGDDLKNLVTSEAGQVRVPWPEPDLTTSSVEEAARELAAGKNVRLAQTSEVNTFIDDLGKMAADAQKAGKEAPSLDLGKVSVPGTNLFTQDSLGIPRIDMPQMAGLPIPGSPAEKLPGTIFEGKPSPWRDISEPFFQSLRDQGVKVEEEMVNPESLRATQTELDGPKIAKTMDEMETEGATPIASNPVVISSDNYILDGHHRWAASLGRDYQTGTDVPHPIKVERIDEPISTLLQQARDFSEKMGIPPQSAFDATKTVVKPPVPAEVPPTVMAQMPDQSIDIGITPFRAGIDNAVGFYDSAKYQQFIEDAKKSADAYGVHIDGIDKVTGIWEGDTEPSVSIHVSPTEPKPEDDTYKIQHRAPTDDGYNAPMYDLTQHDLYPRDIYSKNIQVAYQPKVVPAIRIYGTGQADMDQEAFDIIDKVHGDPSAMVTIYRAVPENVTEINPGDWVSPVKKYAELNGDGNLGQDLESHVISMQVPASQVFTDANSVLEWGWSPPNLERFNLDARAHAFSANLGKSYNQDGVLLFRARTPALDYAPEGADAALDGFKVEYEDYSYEYPPRPHPSKIGKLMKVTDKEGNSLGHFDFYTKPEDPDHVYIGLLALDKKFEGQGYARAMLARVSRDLKRSVVHGNFSTLDGVQFGMGMAARNPDWNLLQLSTDKSGNPVFWKLGDKIDADAQAFDAIPFDQVGGETRPKLQPLIDSLTINVKPTGDDLMATFRTATPQDKVLAAMKSAGVSGGRFTSDGRLQVIGSGADFVKQLTKLGHDLGGYDVKRGTLSMIERDTGDYQKALDEFSRPKGVTATDVPTADTPTVKTARGEAIIAPEWPEMDKLINAPPQKTWLDNLSAADKKILDDWTQTGYIDINDFLAGKKLDPKKLQWYRTKKEVETAADNLKRVVESAPPLPPDTTLYRAVKANGIDPNLSETYNQIEQDIIGKMGLGNAALAQARLRETFKEQTDALANWAQKKYRVGSYVKMGEPGEVESLTTDAALASGYANPYRPGLIFRVEKAHTGAPIWPYSSHIGEHEVLAPPETMYRVKSVTVNHMEDVFPEDHPLVPGDTGADRVVVTIEEAPKCATAAESSLVAVFSYGVSCTDVAKPVPDGITHPTPTVGSGDFFPGQPRDIAEAAVQHRDKQIAQYAADHHMTSGEYKAAAKEVISSYVRAHPQIRIRVTPETLAEIVKDGRYKTEYELPGVTPEMAASRAEAERNMFGYPAGADPVERPVYGYLSGTADEGGIVQEYGDLILNLDPSVNARATFTIGDSYRAAIRGELSPSLLADPGIGSWTGDFDIVKAYESGNLEDISRYVEVEIHGGLTSAEIGGITPDMALIQSREDARRVREAVEAVTELYANNKGTQQASPQTEQAGIPTEPPTSFDFYKSLRDIGKAANARQGALADLLARVGLAGKVVDNYQDFKILSDVANLRI
jgi:ribosomal protein S18 acetylase RimI-like enzyme